MANWKIQDIAPPKKPGKKAERAPEVEVPLQARKKKRRMPKWFTQGVLPLLVLLGISFSAVHFFFATAHVVVRPETRTIKILEPIVAQVGLESENIEKMLLPTRTLTQEEKATRLFPASSTTLKENRASGTIRVYNATDTAKNLIAQTRFISENGKLFRTPVGLSIPASLGDTPGYVDIEVTAAQAGEDYNIGPSNFSLPGLSGSVLFTAIYAKSTQAMSGGSEREISVVSREDIDQAKESLIDELSEKAIQGLLSRIPEQMMATKDSVVVEVNEAVSLVLPGAELDQFNVSVSLTAAAYLFAKADIDVFVQEFLSKELQEGERVAEGTVTTNFQQIALIKDGVSLDLSLEAKGYQYVDPTELKIQLRGKGKQKANDILDSYGVFRESEISLWPFWVSSLPQNVDKLRIEILVD